MCLRQPHCIYVIEQKTYKCIKMKYISVQTQYYCTFTLLCRLVCFTLRVYTKFEQIMLFYGTLQHGTGTFIMYFFISIFRKYNKKECREQNTTNNNFTKNPKQSVQVRLPVSQWQEIERYSQMTNKVPDEILKPLSI